MRYYCARNEQRYIKCDCYYKCTFSFFGWEQWLLSVMIREYPSYEQYNCSYKQFEKKIHNFGPVEGLNLGSKKGKPTT